ncbi:MAG: hypothetical protein M0017_01550, partial [Desulfobacteraceae bacterium]|nr:hypothetical protein [Desulfobacteraceae bacterium]
LDGRITLDIPVSGEIGAPGFSYRNELRRSLRNLLLRTAVAPFSILAAAAPGAKLQESVTFPPGQAEVSPEMAKELEPLVRVMAERPLLNLVLRGFAGDRDRQAGKEVIRPTAAAPRMPGLKPQVRDELLIELASGRSENVQRCLVALGVPEARVAIAPAGVMPAAGGKGRPAGRVEIGLKPMDN